ncbi:MAG TPA: serine/threonine-protein kinase [Solirubrobacteraceae bacterium]|nr:serine/threonine-protein kinase [Solirubrobacteraceae bacterium]
MDHRNTLVAPARADRALALGRYRLRERLGSGGFGVVWSAHDELLHREVAVKRISLPTGEDRERATREALACARLAHPAIVALYEACAEEQDFFLISELVHGQTLAQAIADDALSDEELLEVGVVLCDALAHAHARGVIHRDVKPHNILLPDRAVESPVAGGAAVAKLTDFGGARLAGEDALTRTGDVLGTLAYMAPEQCEGLEAGVEADLYSLALVLYEAFSGVNPVRGPTPAATARRIGSELPALERYRRDLPRSLTRAVDVALASDPREREQLDDLRAACAQALTGARARDGRHATERTSVRAPTAPRPASDDAGWLTLERLLWLVGALALAAWQLAAQRAGVALLALCAALPVVVLVRRPGPRWLVAGIAPLLGAIGLAGAFPAVAGQAAAWRTRALLGALGYWWLRLAEPLLDTASRRLWLGAPAGTGGGTPALAWEGSLMGAAVHALAPLLTLGLLFGALAWALAAAVLPLLVRGRSALRDALAATVWAVALAAGTPLAVGLAARLTAAGTHAAAPRGVVLGAACGALLAVGACALRGRADGWEDAGAGEAVLTRVDGRVG